MNTLVHISGFPESAGKRSVITYCQKLFKKGKYWVKHVKKMPNSNINESLIEFETKNHACNAVDKINRSPLKFKGQAYVLNASLEIPSGNRKRKRSPDENINNLSKLSELADLDIQMQILKKRREILEEETRLLEAERQLKLMQAGFSIQQTYADLETPCSMEDNDEAEQNEECLDTKNESDTNNDSASNKHIEKKIPKKLLFKKPCQRICKQIKRFLKNDYTTEQHLIIHRNLGVLVRRRLTTLMEGKPYMALKNILVLYKEHFEDDKAVLHQVIEKLEASDWKDVNVICDGEYKNEKKVVNTTNKDGHKAVHTSYEGEKNQNTTQIEIQQGGENKKAKDIVQKPLANESKQKDQEEDTNESKEIKQKNGSEKTDNEYISYEDEKIQDTTQIEIRQDDENKKARDIVKIPLTNDNKQKNEEEDTNEDKIIKQKDESELIEIK